MRPLRTLAPVPLVLASVLVALLVGELALRISTPETWGQVANADRSPWLVDDPILAFANRPGGEYASFRINEYGFRGPELSEGARVQRIACLGDSSTFGLWLDGADGRLREALDSVRRLSGGARGGSWRSDDIPRCRGLERRRRKATRARTDCASS